MAQKELNKLEELLKNAENTKYPLLEKANTTVDELTQELKTVTESNDAAIKAPEAVKNKLAEAMGDNSVGNDRAQKQDMENKGEQYVTVIAELDAAEQSRQMHQECDATMKAKSPAFTQAAEAKEVAKANMEKASEISKEITAVNEAIGQVKEATISVQKEQENIFAEKDVQKHLYKATLEESANKFLALKKEVDRLLRFIV